MHLLRVDASIRRESSHSQAVADTFQRAWTGQHPDDDVTLHGLDANPLPYLTLDDLIASNTPVDQRTPEQRAAAGIATAVVDDVMAADVVLMAVPLYNWGTPALFKSWVDHVFNEVRVAGIEKPFAGRTGVLVSARGGCYQPGAPREGWDHVVPYLKHVLGEQLGFDMRVILIEFTLAGINPALAGFMEEAKQSLADAHVAAERLAGELAGSLAVNAAP